MHEQEQQAKSDYNFENYKEENLTLKRQEAKEIYKQFRQLCPMWASWYFCIFQWSRYFW